MRPRPTRGFTLLEVMISLAILATALVAVSQMSGGAVQMHAYARRATQATLLLRGKMLDLEELLTKDGFSDFDDEKHGTFEDEGAPEFKWRAEILKPKVSLDADQLLGLLGVGGKKPGGAGADAAGVGAGLGGALSGAAALLGGAQGGPTPVAANPLAAAGPFAGIIQGQAKTFVETLKKSVREVRVTVTWQDGKLEREISASQQMVILPESVGKAGQTVPTQPQPPQLPPGTPPFQNGPGNLVRPPAGQDSQ